MGFKSTKQSKFSKDYIIFESKKDFELLDGVEESLQRLFQVIYEYGLESQLIDEDIEFVKDDINRINNIKIIEKEED